MEIYKKEDALKKTTEYFNGDDLAAEVFVSKYALRNRELELVECEPNQTHRRMAKEFARIEKKYPNPMSEDEIFELFKGFKEIVPQGSIMSGCGNPFQVTSLSNCFVIDTVDSYGGICRTDERIAQIAKRRGGVGVDISPLRPKGQPTKNSALTTDGIVVFMERFSNTAREVAQNGRRGALMISISVHHPEILNFIRAKRDLKKVNGANISIRVTNEFMEAVRKNKTYEQRWPVDSDKPVISNKVMAKDIWGEMIKSVYVSAEPGILFWDNIIQNSPADSYADVGFKTSSTNPCGELPAAIADACRLMCINLVSFVDDPFTSKATFNIDRFADRVSKAQKLSDDLVDLEYEAITKIIEKVKNDPENKEIKANELELWKNVRLKCEQGRRTGLGITGLGDTIAMLNVKYGSKESLAIVEKIYSTLRNEAYKSSIQMAKDRGSFPIFDASKEKNNEFLNRLPGDIKTDMKKHGRRNIACLTTPPAGSISTLTQTSSGFEPVFKAKYIRRRKLTENDKIEPDYIDDLGDKWKNYTIEHHGLKLFKAITGKEFEQSPYNGAQAEEIDCHMRIKMQALATKYVDHAISSTVNLPSDVPIEVVGKLYMEANDEGCKGLTIYRAKSRDGVLVDDTDFQSTKNCDDCDEASKNLVNLINLGRRPKNIIQSTAPKRTLVVPCDIHRSKIDKGDWLFFVGLLSGQPYEIFGGDSEKFVIPHKYKSGWIIKNGKDKDGVTQYNLILGSLDDANEKLEFKGITKHFNNYEYGAFTRLCSLTIRHGVPIKYICEQITKPGVEGDLYSFQRAMARILKKYIAEGERACTECPKCHSEDVIYKGGCPTCTVCGHSNCA